MPPHDAPLDDLADAVLDGQSIDWTAARSEGAEAGIIEQLGVIARIRNAHLGPGTPWSGERWGHLHLVEPIGRGAFGTSYRAWDPRLERQVALKLIPAPDSSAPAADTVVDEGRLLAKVHHPNVVTIYGADCIDGTVGLWMELVPGVTLSDRVRMDGPLAPADVLEIGIVMSAALEAVHRAGLVHGDVKAQNVMQAESGRLVLMDFGASHEPRHRAADRAAVGTPVYVAPEVLNGEPPTPASDVYSLGVLLFFLLTGRYPVSGSTLQDVREGHARGRSIDEILARAQLPRAMRRVLGCVLTPDPALRLRSAAQLEALLRRVKGRRGWARRAALAAAIVLPLLTGALVWRWWAPPTVSPAAEVEARAWILVSRFENTTGDPDLDRALEYALERELATSTLVSVVPRERVEDALRLMRRPLDTDVDREIAREVSIRDGEIRAFVSGRAERLGSTYVLTAQLVQPSNGQTVATIVEEAEDKERLPGAIRRASTRLRAELGERRDLARRLDARDGARHNALAARLSAV